MNATEKEDLVAGYLLTREGSERVAATLQAPLAQGTSYRLALCRIFSPGKPDPSRKLTSERMSVTIPWKDVVDTQTSRWVRLGQIQTKVMTELASSLDIPLFEHLLAAPVVGKFSKDLVKEKVISLTVETEQGAVYRPIILLNAITYARLAMGGILGLHSDRQLGGILGLHSDRQFEGCRFLVTSRIDSEDLMIVARDPGELHGEVEVKAKLTDHGEKAGKVGFEFEASVSVSDGWPTVARLRLD